ncbi:unnamed protein product [Brassica oleracea var. botrytis]|uniref:MULE transposase N-terminal all-beta domain-containing protein n=1 Tax=Brassica oleracea TaxID=3712 RepID=A0A3P6DJM8_BRAOL|nr:unnamed protein product [Brassica oleracea]
MSDSSSSTTGGGIRVRTPGIPIKDWCGERIKELISKTNLNPYRRTSSLEDITYSLLKERICRKMGIYPFTKRLNLSFVPLVVEPKRQSYILDDEDVFVYQTSVDKEQKRSILHLEDIQELEIVQIIEQLSRVE